jgi:sec-independent protein translocase protein TatC
MGLLEHLEELRRRLFRCCIAVANGMANAFTVVGPVLDFVLVPVQRALPAGSSIVYTNPSEGFSLYVDLALITGALIASPYVMFQVWRFIAPGLYAIPVTRSSASSLPPRYSPHPAMPRHKSSSRFQ